jgi:kinetochore protein NDC80
MAMIKKETQDYTSRCSAEAKKMLEDIQLADHDVGIMEREVAEVLKVKILILIFLYNSRINCILTSLWEKALIVAAVYVLNV